MKVPTELDSNSWLIILVKTDGSLFFFFLQKKTLLYKMLTNKISST